MLTAAWNVSPGTSPKGVVVRLNNAGHSDSDLTHEAMMFASELNVRSVEVSTPLGGAARTSAMPPVSTLARLPAIAAALPMPGNGPAMPPVRQVMHHQPMRAASRQAASQLACEQFGHRGGIGVLPGNHSKTTQGRRVQSPKSNVGPMSKRRFDFRLWTLDFGLAFPAYCP